MVTINNTTLRANIYETFYDLFNAISWTSGTVSVTGAYYSGRDATFPQVVINPANISIGENSFDRSNSTKVVNVIIGLYTKKNKQLDQISDDIFIATSGTKIAGLMFIESDEGSTVDTDTTNKLYSKSISLTYKRR